MSIIIVVFPAAPKVSQEAVDKEHNFEENIKKKANGEIFFHKFVPFYYLKLKIEF